MSRKLVQRLSIATAAPLRQIRLCCPARPVDKLACPTYYSPIMASERVQRQIVRWQQ